MATGTKRRKSRPAETNRAALSRWGFIGRAHRMPAYTGEHFEADAKAGFVDAPVPERGCPTSRPERDCPVEATPTYYRCIRAQRMVVIGPAPDDRHKPKSQQRHDHQQMGRRWVQYVGCCCYDCRLALEWHDHQVFFVEFGDHGLGDMRPTLAVRMMLHAEEDDADSLDTTRLTEFLRASNDIDRRERADLTALTGIDVDEDWYAVRVLLRSVRHCLTRHLLAITTEPETI